MGILSVIAGLLGSYCLDFPAGPSVVTVMGVVLAAAAVITGGRRRERSGRAGGDVTGGF
jgi:ABC-type Mn2+/Zn2+ transport system permease subunit